MIHSTSPAAQWHATLRAKSASQPVPWPSATRALTPHPPTVVANNPALLQRLLLPGAALVARQHSRHTESATLQVATACLCCRLHRARLTLESERWWTTHH